ncbi:hypothetical protein [Mitsuaria sp. PDC51]|uniref:DUF7673 family protein n=1 Tax=Mitsuaria sp. PDC51 TaxID=1881035 RepID=UPI00114018A6|nr:hypothetical protein [Mitsuaria sp. PDC51]
MKDSDEPHPLSPARAPMKRQEPSVEQVEARRREREAEQLAWAERARAAQQPAREALELLLSLAERSDTGQARRAATFVAAVAGYQHFDMYSLRSLDVELSDAMLACLDGVRWAQCPLMDLVPRGRARIDQVCVDWGFKAP